jgi:uncharacterized membrane protein
MRQPTETTLSDTFVLKVLQKHRAAYIIPLVVFMLAFVIRSYRLSQNPLWLDEIYGYLLASQGLPKIFLNSLGDPHPPLYYILQWMTTGCGAWNSEWGLRWFPLLTGALTVPLVYLIADKLTNRLGAFIAAIIFAISPMHVFYSQESRSYAFVTFLAAISMLLTIRLMHDRTNSDHNNRWSWVGLCFISIMGLYSSYSYLLVAGVQVLFLGKYFFHRGSYWAYVACLVASILGLLPFLSSLQKTAAIHMNGIALDVVRLMQALLAGEPVRYGFIWSHTLLPPLFVLLVVVGAAYSARRFPKDPSATYVAFQVFLPVALFFGALVPLFDLRLPVVENKQFVVIQPALYALVGVGFGFLLDGSRKRMGLIPAILIFLVIVAGSFNSLTRYWSISKSPEGLAVLHIRQNLRAGDTVVSLHYSTDAALSFYLPNAPVYANPRDDAGRWTLSSSDIAYSNPHIPQTMEVRKDLDQVWGKERTWLLSRDGYNLAAIERIKEACSAVGEKSFPPFNIILLEDCK